MQASRPSSSCRLIRLVVALVALLVIAGCASRGGGATMPSAPDESVLAPAEQALAEARDAEADTFAPRVVDASRRRIATARDILFTAARDDRPLNDTERARVEQLVDAATLDARSVLAQTQARAVQAKLDELRADLGGATATGDRSTGPEDAP